MSVGLLKTIERLGAFLLPAKAAACLKISQASLSADSFIGLYAARFYAKYTISLK